MPFTELTYAAERAACRPTQWAAAKPNAGNSACKNAKAADSERWPPEAKVTASVVSVAWRPAPMNCVDKYCATLTAKPIANADASGAVKRGHLTCHQKAQRLRRKVSAAQAKR